ncbi:membrane lipoprotein lipid attachment site-containing protein [Breznakiella homolactica]|uniref:Membrane lipoprotein lipid attachment site-containing protein n=1 Tax=Breznakiella homolactica TaxID=2798577 RepID=A0A7T8B8P8_9SPIR|nr:membrane lipoprotein lipid attachment site-containing protein [Breznakiella homolactica]QQO07607.1 membrane lipoprotein lipid attachment site-containing protein [Breznakiella homolactica]
MKKLIFITLMIVVLSGCTDHKSQETEKYTFHVMDYDNDKRIIIFNEFEEEIISLILFGETDSIGQIYVNNYKEFYLNIVRYDETLFAYVIGDENANYNTTTHLSKEGLTLDGLIVDRNEYFDNHGVNYQLFSNGQTKTEPIEDNIIIKQ